MKADAKLDAVLRAHCLLDGYRALNGLDPAHELGQQTVPSCFEYAATMRSHLRIDHGRTQGSQLRQRARLVGTDQPRVTHHISRQDGRQSPTACLRAHACPPAATLRSRA
jgi:hypothetical protein